MTIPLSFTWRNALFSNWPVDSQHLSSHLPARLDVEEYDGTGWLSVVPFRNVDTRPRGLPPVAGLSFPELNLRTYVTCDGEPGVYFFSLDAPSVLSVLGARTLHHLPYYYARMELTHSDGTFRFRSRRLHPGDRPVLFDVSYSPHEDWFVAEQGSLAEFLTERRRLYTQGSDGGIRYTDVSHERWPLAPVSVTMEAASLFRANGFEPPGGDGVHYYSPGVDVVTGWNRQREHLKRTAVPRA